MLLYLPIYFNFEAPSKYLLLAQRRTPLAVVPSLEIYVPERIMCLREATTDVHKRAQQPLPSDSATVSKPHNREMQMPSFDWLG